MKASYLFLSWISLAFLLIPFLFNNFSFNFESNEHHSPVWSNNATLYPSGIYYEPNRIYGFQIFWNDSESGIEGISQVIFEWCSNTCINYTYPDVLNNSLGTYWINLTDLPAGLYYYTWYAVNSSGYWGKSDTWVYEIKKAPVGIKLFLNGTEGNRYYSLDARNNFVALANFTAFLNVSGKMICLEANISGFESQCSSNSFIQNLTYLKELGVYNITAYFIGDQNYTSASVTYFAFAQNISVSINLDKYVVNPGDNVTVFGKAILLPDNENVSLAIILFLFGWMKKESMEK